MVGASGAVSGILGAYLVLYPNARVWTLVIVGFFVRVIAVPALVVLGFWVVLQVLHSVFTFARGETGGVAFLAHVGGFVAGIALIHSFRSPAADPVWRCAAYDRAEARTPVSAPLDPIKFGTSGWRARIAETYTFANVRRLTRAIADHLRETGEAGHGAVVGYDTRFLSEDFARGRGRNAGPGRGPVPARGRGRADAHRGPRRPPPPGGRRHHDHGQPQPGVGQRAQALGTDRGARPPGGDAGDRGARRRPRRPGRAADRGGAGGGTRRVGGLRAGLPRAVPALIDLAAIRRARLRVVVDVMHGPARGYLDRLLEEAGCEVTLLHGARDVTFGGHPPEPAEEHLGELIRTVRARGAHLGLATDGDADRFGVVDRDGTVLAPNPILALVLRHLLGHRGWRGGVARSVATTHLLDALAARHGCELHETPVGFKYVGDLITQGRAMFGGEESGGMSLRGHPPEKDGILACLLAAEVAAVEGAALGDVLERLHGEVGRLLSVRVNVPLVRSGAPRRCRRGSPSLRAAIGRWAASGASRRPTG